MTAFGLFRIFALALGAILSLAPIEVSAGALFAGTGKNDGGRIITIDPTTGAGALIGSSGFGEISGLAFDSAGVLFGVTGGSMGPSSLVTVNTTTGVATGIAAVASSSGEGFGGLAFDAAGRLFASAWNGNTGELWTIDPGNAAQTFIGTISGCSGDNFVAGIAVSAAGALFGSRGNSTGHVENIVTLDPATAACTPIGNGSSNPISDLAFDPDTGILYGVTGGSRSLLLSIDPVSGAETVIGPIGFDSVSSLAIRSIAPPAPVPTLGEWSMIAMGMLLAVAGALAIRRRRATS
jgi:exosortase sorting signal-containing protein